MIDGSPRNLDTPQDDYAYQTDGRLKRDNTVKYSYTSSGNVSAIDAAPTTHLHYYANRLQRLSVGESDASPLYFNWDPTNGWRSAQGPNNVPGDQLASQPIRTAYNVGGQLSKYLDTDKHLKATYTYDGNGQRLASRLVRHSDLDPAQQLVTSSDYVYDGAQLLAVSVTQTDGQTTPVLKAAWQLWYLYGPDGHPYAGIYLDLQSGATHIFTIVTDDRGDVLELLDGGLLFAQYRYNAWGLPTDSGARATRSLGGALDDETAGQISKANLLRYAGYLYDDYSGLYYLQSRYYDPATRSFLSRDLAAADGLESAYQYCGGNPVAAVDPTGERPTPWVDDEGPRAPDFKPHASPLTYYWPSYWPSSWSLPVIAPLSIHAPTLVVPKLASAGAPD